MTEALRASRTLGPLPLRLAAENCREGRHTPDWQFKTRCVICGAKRDSWMESIGIANLCRTVYGDWTGSRYV